ncbi:MAG: helix-turn-helix transcriptional regulator [Anaerolineales bacterium]|nr:helix-turn-helix transcriptional regulator [Anaerolineales bacterium]MCW5855321.1 helix-turn-helix transcriptional regulator [Anaerolineales bacterium]
MATDRSFSTWLQAQLSERGWTAVYLARRTQISQTHISRLLSGLRRPGPEALKEIARAFDVPPELVFDKAGVLPARGEISDDERQWLHIFDQAASDEERAELLERAELELARLREKRKGKSTP